MLSQFMSTSRRPRPASVLSARRFALRVAERCNDADLERSPRLLPGGPQAVKLLVTGAAGYLAGRIARRLAGAGQTVRGDDAISRTVGWLRERGEL